MTWRNIKAKNRTPIQQSLAYEPRGLAGTHNVTRLMQGVVIDVFPSDDEQGNRTSWQSEDRHGFHHECSVLIVNDGGSTYMVLPHVIIPPNAPSGMDDYEERLPRPSTRLTTGEALSSGLDQVDPNDLDGDMCVVGFMGGQIDQPFIVSWWPHPRNMYDPATSGLGFPDANGEGRALEQHRRYFRRINGVETTITPAGDIILSTSLAGSSINTQGDPENGRFARSNVDDGGSIRLYMKPQSTLEWLWDAQIDGVGAVDNAEPSLPQTNPSRPNAGSGSNNKISTYLIANENSFLLKTPTLTTVQAGTSIRLKAKENLEIFANEDLLATIDQDVIMSAGGQGTIDITGSLGVTSGEQMRLQAGDVAVSTPETAKLLLMSDADITLAASTIVAISGDESLSLRGGSTGGEGLIDLTDSGVKLGNGAADALIKGTTLNDAWGLLTLPAAGSGVGTNKVAFDALLVAVTGMVAALGLSLSTVSTTK